MPANIADLVASLRRFQKTPLTQLATSLDKADELRFTYDRMSKEMKDEHIGHNGYTQGQILESSLGSNRKSLRKKWAAALPLLVELKEHVLIRQLYDKCYKLMIGERELNEPLRRLGYTLRNEDGLLPDEQELFEDYLKVKANKLPSWRFNQRYPIVENDKAVSL